MGGGESLKERTHFPHAFFVLNEEQYALQTFETPALGAETRR